MAAKATHQRNMFLRIIRAPFRVLGKARDFYVRSITNCSDGIGYGGMAGMGAVQSAPLPRSFSAASSRSSDNGNDDYMELIRAASSKTLGNKFDVEMLLKQQMMESSTSSSNLGSRKMMMPRSTTVAMGRIDEDKPFNFGDDSVNVKTDLKYPRSRSVATTKRSVVF